MMRELNASSYAVSTLRKLWSYKKREDGTLIITKYKGKDLEVRVPEKIGNGIVTAIGDGAFSGDYDSLFCRVTSEQARWHNEIVKITLPKTIQSIGEGAFLDMCKLETVDMPEGVKEIGESAFRECSSLKRISIPGTVENIDDYAFSYCKMLEKVHICEGVLEIGELAFMHCINLEEASVPKSIQLLRTVSSTYGHDCYEVFGDCPKLIVYCPEGSKAEEYCKKNNFRYKNCQKKAD